MNHFAQAMISFSLFMWAVSATVNEMAHPPLQRAFPLWFQPGFSQLWWWAHRLSNEYTCATRWDTEILRNLWTCEKCFACHLWEQRGGRVRAPIQLCRFEHFITLLGQHRDRVAGISSDIFSNECQEMNDFWQHLITPPPPWNFHPRRLWLCWLYSTQGMDAKKWRHRGRGKMSVEIYLLHGVLYSTPCLVVLVVT